MVARHMLKSILAPVVLLALLTLAGYARPVQAEVLSGTPLLRRYLPQDYNAPPQHWAIATDHDGRLFVGNGEGVLRYDGVQWDLIGLPGRAPARKVEAGRDGRIYVGSHDTFGWLQTTPDGPTVYRELLSAFGMKGRARDIGTVWQIIAVARGVYFRTETTLYLLGYDHRPLGQWPLGEDQRVMYAQGEQLYARIDGVGFSRFVDGRFELEPGGARFARRSVLGVIDQPGGRLLVGTDRFYRADASGIEPMPGRAGSPLRGNHPYAVLQLADGSFVVGTLDGELFRFGRDGALRDRVGLGVFGIAALGTDREGGLWAATEGDLVRMSMPSPWSSIGAVQGLDGSVSDFEWHDGALWLATTRGLARMQAGADGGIQATAVPWLEFDGVALASTDGGLLIAHRDGVMVLDAGAQQPRSLMRGDLESVRELVVSRFDPGRAYALGVERLLVLGRDDGGRWQLAAALPLAGAGAATLLEAAPGELWFGDSRGGPQRWTLDADGRTLRRKDVFGPQHGLVLDPHFGSRVFLLDGQVHVVSGARGFRHAANRFVADDGPPLALVDRPDELVVEATPLGTYAFSRRQLWLRPAGQATWQRLHLGSPLGAGYNRLRYNRDGVVRVSTWNGLLQFDPAQPQPTPAPLALGFEHAVVEDEDGRQTRSLAPGNHAAAKVPTGHRLRLRYEMVSLDSGPEFRSRLQGPGVAGEWSPWGGRDLVVPAGAAGDYRLVVEARTTSGRSAAPVVLRYRVLPRWHQQWWVRLVGAVLLAGLAVLAIRGFVRRRTRRYAQSNRRLEARIDERTHELEQLNRQLADLATRDALTGVANRRAMQNGLQREWLRCVDQRRPLSVLMIDVDFFKRYNDTHGHLEGDVLLRTIAQNLQALHDPTRELLARFGGEEFALLLPGVPQCDALRRAETIRSAIQQRVGEITISIGVAGFTPTAHDDAMDLLRRADAALYRAKRAGRNRVEAAVEEVAGVPT